MDLLKYFIYGFENKNSILKNILLFYQALKCRLLTKLGINISPLLKTILPEGIIRQMIKIYKGII
jgi:hypothetical protein